MGQGEKDPKNIMLTQNDTRSEKDRETERGNTSFDNKLCKATANGVILVPDQLLN